MNKNKVYFKKEVLKIFEILKFYTYLPMKFCSPRVFMDTKVSSIFTKSTRLCWRNTLRLTKKLA